jgi:hypothetical protein
MPWTKPALVDVVSTPVRNCPSVVVVVTPVRTVPVEGVILVRTDPLVVFSDAPVTYWVGV